MSDETESCSLLGLDLGQKDNRQQEGFRSAPGRAHITAGEVQTCWAALRHQCRCQEGKGGEQRDTEGVLECLEALDFCLLIFYYHVSNLTQNINFVGREKHIF